MSIWKKYRFPITVAIIALVIFIINALTPYIADDYVTLQHTYFQDRSRMIGSFFDAVKSSLLYYETWGGRFFAFLLFTGLCFLPHILVAFLNTAAYLLVTWLIYDIIRGNRAHNYLVFLSVHLLLWICVPEYGQIMFWMCGAANYLYMTIPVLLLIRLFRRVTLDPEEKHSVWLIALMTVVGFVAGEAMEQISAGMLVVITLYLLYIRVYKKAPPGISVLLPYISSLIGFCFSFFAPGNSARAATVSGYPFIVKFGAICYYDILFLGIPAVLFIFGILHENQHNKQICLESGIYAAASLIVSGVLIVTPSIPERGYYIAVVFAVMAAGFACYDWSFQLSDHLVMRVIAAGLSLFVLAQAGDTMLASYDIYTQTKAREAMILAEKEKGNMEISVPVIEMRYPLKANHYALVGLSDISVTDYNFWTNAALAQYYQVNSITGIPSDNTIHK